ncbi:MAG: hypothetical protein IJ852_06690, partial [Alphaproteobacteria bacterium]|nr:hypothetical protein [Alphaproteobacteria bacterium]
MNPKNTDRQYVNLITPKKSNNFSSLMFICGAIFSCASVFVLPAIVPLVFLILLLIFHVYYFKKADVVGISIEKSRINRRLYSIGLFLREFLRYQPQRENSGYVLILVTAFIPIVLLGVKYAEKLFDYKDMKLKEIDSEEQVEIVSGLPEAALAVAQNWNPGLTLGQQREGVYKVADAICSSTSSVSNSILGRAIPGVVAHDKNGNKIVSRITSTSGNGIQYNTNTLYFPQIYFNRNSTYALMNYHYGLWLAADKASAPALRTSVFDELDETELSKGNYVLKQHEIFIDPHPYTSYIASGYPSNSYYVSDTSSTRYNVPSTTSSEAGNYNAKTLLSAYTTMNTYSNNSSYSLAKSTYTSRRESFTSGDLSIGVYNDNIQLRSSSGDVSYAVPAQCNVDIVLAIPVNGAACNADNRDAASDTAGTPYYHTTGYRIPADAKKTPIYQMGQACKNFVKDNFYHIRGVYMSLIPYSAKISLSPDRTAWTTAIPAFVETPDDTAVMLGACLYSTSGVKDAALKQSYKTKALVSGDTLPTTDTPYYWGGVLTGCPIMCRRGTLTCDPRYGNNYIAGGLLNNTTNPSSGDQYKYRRMNLNPCYGGYASLLGMRCEKNCTHFLPNPYYVIEPTADLVKIYEMCNALYPFHDLKNVSNFIFAPLEWANNMFQSWTNNPSVSTTAGTGDSAVLSRPSKTTSGRKKAIILLVNKPDWFEPGELTYLGFDNDASEIPMAESDKIDFSINYSDTSYKFLDGTAYNGTIAGPKKILRIERVSGSNLTYNNGYYEANGTYRLKFPRKGMVKLKVAQPKTYTGTVTFYTDNIGSTYDVRKDSTSGTSISLGT